MNTQDLILDANTKAIDRECKRNYLSHFDRHVKEWCDICEMSPCKCDEMESRGDDSGKYENDNSDEYREREAGFMNQNSYEIGGNDY